MHLLNTSTPKLTAFFPTDIPPYIILSHRWENEEVSFQDLTEAKPYSSKLRGWAKLEKFCSLARADGWEWVWMDTCCIDKSSSMELSKAINSMYQWYEEAQFCVAYLGDISVPKNDGMEGTKSEISSQRNARMEFCKSGWFKRGWTLQELLAPKEVVFYDKHWISIGTRHNLKPYISRATSIDVDHLENPQPASLAQKMSWASERETSEPEDIAYSLLGLFNLNMSLLYGEGAVKAFRRLQLEIVRSHRDETIFAWTSSDHKKMSNLTGDLLAPAPKSFSLSGDIVPIKLTGIHDPVISFDGIQWTIERNSKRRLDRNFQTKFFGLDHLDAWYVVPLACAKQDRKEAPVMITFASLQSGDWGRLVHQKNEFLTANQLSQMQDSKIRSLHTNCAYQLWKSKLTIQPTIYPGFTLRLAAAAKYRYSLHKYRGEDCVLHAEKSKGIYVISHPMKKRQRDFGVILRSKSGASVIFAFSQLCEVRGLHVLKIKTTPHGKKTCKKHKTAINLDLSFGRNAASFIGLDNRRKILLGSGEYILVIPRHGWRDGMNHIIIDIECGAA